MNKVGDTNISHVRKGLSNLLALNCQVFISIFLFASFGTFSQSSFTIPKTKPLLGEIHYGNRVGGIIGQEGDLAVLHVFDHGAKEYLKSLRIGLNSNGLVSSIQFEKSTGEVLLFGNPACEWQKTYVLSANKEIVGISGAAGWFVDRLQFHFSDGSSTPKYGSSGGDLSFELFINKDKNGNLKGKFLGLWGSHTHAIETLGLVFWPIE